MAINKFQWATAAFAALAFGFGVPTAAVATTTDPTECTEAGNVWVHVENEEKVSGGCATEFANALEATASAGLTDGANTFVTTIDGYTADEAEEEFWSLWSYENEEWTFAQVGADQMPLEAGDVIGWALQPDWNVNPAPAPTADPMAALAAEAATDEAPAEDTNSNTFLWIIAGVALLIVIGIGIIAATRKKPEAGR